MVAILALLGACYLHIRSAVCTTEIDRKLRNLSGLDFEIATTSCSGFGASVHTKIFVSKSGAFVKTLLFEYDPIDWIRLPSISVPTNDRIIMTVPRVAEVFAGRHRWRGMTIEYDIANPGSSRYEETLDGKD